MVEINKLDLKSLVRSYKDFPKRGIVFRDVNPLFRNYKAINEISKEFIDEDESREIDLIVGIESRGFTIASLLACNFHKGLVLVRKAGKLPGETLKKSYEIEYGNATIEIQKDAVNKNQKVLIADDLIATGGTAIATAELIQDLGGVVFGFAFIIDLIHLGGSYKLKDKGYRVISLVKYDE
jgi:adenine phosphoribosyltransferase